MSYFNHAFCKRFLGGNSDGIAVPTSSQGFVLQGSGDNYKTVDLSRLAPGYFGFFDAKDYTSVSLADLQAPDYNCCKLILASSSLLSDDKVGKFHGGYRETNKSKMINPRYVSKWYRVDPCTPQQAIVHVGNTNFNADTDEDDLGNSCCKEFYCDETYYLRVDVKGSPALRFANHNLYQSFQADGGCCDGPEPTAVDSTLIFIQWAKQIVESEYFKDFVRPVVFDEAGNPWFATEEEADAAGWSGNTFALYTDQGHTPGACAGMRLLGAFVETKFGNCSFESTDFFEKEPIRIYASLVDYTGDPCVFEGLCVTTECEGLQGMGFGEQVLRDFILSEKYLTNTFANDKRIREITQGDDILNAIDRETLYTRYYLQHSVPRFNNPSSQFDNDQYLLEIVTEGVDANLEAFVAEWLSNCSDCNDLETFDCAPCSPEALPSAP
jgi:hypothetical protein